MRDEPALFIFPLLLVELGLPTFRLDDVIFAAALPDAELGPLLVPGEKWEDNTEQEWGELSDKSLIREKIVINHITPWIITYEWSALL